MRASFCFLICSLAVLLSAAAQADVAEPTSKINFKPFLGWWSGIGRLGLRNGEVEQIRCRATYRQNTNTEPLRQVVRCATASGSVEIAGVIQDVGGRIEGTWEERKYNLSGQVSGSSIPDGFKVSVSGENLAANMTVVVKKSRQIVEIQFLDSTLIGLSMVLTKGTAK